MMKSFYAAEIIDSVSSVKEIAVVTTLNKAKSSIKEIVVFGGLPRKIYAMKTV